MSTNTSKWRPGFSIKSSSLLGLQSQQTECRLQTSISRSLACPDYVLPEIAYQAFQELRRNIRGVSDEVIMAAILAAMSFSCQRWIRVKPPHMDIAHVVTLALYVGADTGSGKSPVMGKLFMPAHRVSRELAEEHKRGEKGRKADQALLRARRRGALNRVSRLYGRRAKADPEEIAQAEQAFRDLPDTGPSESKPVYMVKSDISPAKLLDELGGDRGSILVATAEGRRFFGKMNDEDMELHNLILDGAITSHERMHHTVIANDPLATYCIFTHPDKFDRFIKRNGNEARCSGWFARGLLAKAPPVGDYPPPMVLNPTFPMTDIFNARSLELLKGFEEVSPEQSFVPIALEFDEEATIEFMEMLRENDRRMAARDDWGLIKEFGRKHASNVARIAAIFHYFSEQPDTHISKATLLKAIYVADWYMQQAKQIFVIEPMRLKLEKLVNFLCDKCFNDDKHVKYTDRGEEHLIPERWIMQYHNIKKEDLFPLLQVLEDENVVETCVSRSGKDCVQLNPMHFSRL